MKNLRLSVKLIGGFLIVALITLGVGFFGWKGVSQTDEALKEVAQVRLPSILGLGILNEAQTAIHRYERTLVYEKDPEIVKRQFTQLEDSWKDADRGWKIYEPLPQPLR